MVTRTLLPLTRFAEIVGYSPILFNQVTVQDLQDASSCSDPVLQYTWQPRGGGRPGREEIALAIQQAELSIERVTRFSPAVRWYADDIVETYGRGRVGGSYGGWWGAGPVIGWPWEFSVRANGRYLVSGGVEAWTLVMADAAVTYTDEDGDGYNETATVSVNTTVANPDEIAVYYPVSVGDGTTFHDEEWEIRPIQVKIDAGVATITFKRHMAVRRVLLEQLDAGGVDGLVDGNFLGVVDVYRHYNDPSVMGVAEWEGPLCWTDTSGAECMTAAQTMCMHVINERSGIVALHVASWSAESGAWLRTCPGWWTQPYRVRLNYRAGYQDKKLPRPMSSMWRSLERVTAYLALTYLDREWLSCEQIRNLQAHWRYDLAARESSATGSVGFVLSPRLLDNPLGTTRAAIEAWRVLQPLIVGEAVLG